MKTGIKNLAVSVRNSTRPFRKRYGIKPLAIHLEDMARLRIGRAKRSASKSTFIGITGSSGKTTTTALLSHILQGSARVQTQLYSNTMKELRRSLSRLDRRADYLVAELGVTGIGTMAPMAKLLRPHVGIVTKVGLEHYTAFRSKEAIGREKGALIEALPATGLAILNIDDPQVVMMAQRTSARVITFGWSEDADYRVVEANAGLPNRLSVRVRCPNGAFDLRTPFVGEEFWLATVAAFAGAVELGTDPQLAAAQIESFEPPLDRCGLLETIGGPSFILDTVKAPSESIPAAMSVLGRAQSAYKRVVVGHISDYSGNPRKHYRIAYHLGRASADEVIFVGENIHRAPATPQERMDGVYKGFRTTREAAEYIKKTGREGELILLKGSRNLHLERIALTWTETVKCWEQTCGKSLSCIQCGMMSFPFEEHGKVRRARRKQKLKFWVRQST